VPAKSGAKTPVVGAKSDVHGMNTLSPHHARVTAPVKTAQPAKKS
jgi:hypothetical protein